MNIHNKLFLLKLFLPMSQPFNWPKFNCDFNQLTHFKNQQKRTSPYDENSYFASIYHAHIVDAFGVC